MKKFIIGLIFLILTQCSYHGCAIKPKYLIEESLQEKAQQEIQHRQDDWNWKNRQRFQKEKREFLERNEKVQRRLRNKRIEFGRRSYRALGYNTYNARKRGSLRKHVTPKKHNDVKVHKKNYWSKTTKDPKEDSE